MHKGAVSQRPSLGRAFKGLGVAKRYCRRDSIGDNFVQGAMTKYWVFIHRAAHGAPGRIAGRIARGHHRTGGGQRKDMSVWKRIVALPLCACLLTSCSMRAVRVQNPALSVGSSETERLHDLLTGQEEAPTVEPATQSWESVAFIPVVSSVEVDLTMGETITGKFRSADERELVLEQDGLLRRVSRAEIQRVILYKGRHAGRGALWGLGIGAVTGLFVGINERPKEQTRLYSPLHWSFPDSDLESEPCSALLFGSGL